MKYKRLRIDQIENEDLQELKWKATRLYVERDLSTAKVWLSVLLDWMYSQDWVIIKKDEFECLINQNQSMEDKNEKTKV